MPSHNGNEAYSKDKFIYNKENNTYTCPQGFLEFPCFYPQASYLTRILINNFQKSPKYKETLSFLM